MECLKTFKSFAFLFLFVLGFHSSFAQSKRSNLKQKLSNITVFYFDSFNGSLFDSSKYEYIYDINGLVSSKLSYYWENDRNDWSIPYKDEYFRDASGNLTLHLGLGFSNKEGYINRERERYIYDINGSLIEKIDSFRNYGSEVWTIISKYENTYNGSKQLIGRTNSLWNDTIRKWIITNKTEYDYDINGNTILHLLLVWDTTLNKLDSSSKYEFIFDKDNYVVNQKTSKWYKSSNTWMLIGNGEYFYNLNGKLVFYKSGSRSSVNSLYDSLRLTYLYDSWENLIELKQESWDSLDKKWVNEFNSKYSYDISIESAQLILPSELRIYGYPTYKNKMTEKVEYKWNPKTSSWEKSQTSKFNYSNFVSMDKSDNGVLVFPNPSSGEVFVEVQKHPGKITFNVFDLSGKLVKTNDSNGSGFINIDGLAKGLYILRVYEDDRLISKAKILLKE